MGGSEGNGEGRGKKKGQWGQGGGEAGRTGPDGGRGLAGLHAAQGGTPTRGSGGAEVPFLGKTQHPQG